MQPTVRIVVSLALLTSAFASYHSNTKLRRDGVLNLYPFPRVGRALPSTWEIPINDFYNNMKYERTRRFSPKLHLPVFPRTGRSVLSQIQHLGEALEMPVRRNDDPGMWFGPRLGRDFKRVEDDTINQSENTDLSEPEQIESDHVEREKRQSKLMLFH